MRQYGLNMITNTLQDPDQIKSNNEVVKAELKRRLAANDVPGPGSYNPARKPPIGGPTPAFTPELIAEIKRKDKSLLSKLGL